MLDSHTPNAKPVKKSKIAQVFREIGKKMLFYFDYGDGWRFIVELKEIKELDFKISYSNLLEKLVPILNNIHHWQNETSQYGASRRL